MRPFPHAVGLAALTVAGGISGWDEALCISREKLGGTLYPERLLEDAIRYAGDGAAVTRTLANNAASNFSEPEKS